MIPQIPLITMPIRQLNMRLFELCAKKADGTITRSEEDEYRLMCAVEEQDNYREIKA